MERKERMVKKPKGGKEETERKDRKDNGVNGGKLELKRVLLKKHLNNFVKMKIVVVIVFKILQL